MSTLPADAFDASSAEEGLFAPRHRTLTLGLAALVRLAAIEGLAIATVMPVASAALDGVAWYGIAFGGPLAAGVLAMVCAGAWSDARGPAPPLWAGIALLSAG